MEDNYDKVLDATASLVSSLDQLQADINFGRVYYALVPEVQHELDLAQADVNRRRLLVEAVYNAFKKKS